MFGTGVMGKIQTIGAAGLLVCLGGCATPAERSAEAGQEAVTTGIATDPSPGPVDVPRPSPSPMPPAMPSDAPATPAPLAEPKPPSGASEAPLPTPVATPREVIHARPGTPLSQEELTRVYEGMRQDIRDGDLQLGLRRYAAARPGLAVPSGDPRQETAADVELLAKFIESMTAARSAPPK